MRTLTFLIVSVFCTVSTVLSTTDDEEKRRFLLQLFEKMDTDENGLIVEDEAVSWMSKAFETLGPQDTKFEFDRADTDSDGYVTLAENMRFYFVYPLQDMEAKLENNTLQEMEKYILQYEKQKFTITDKNKDGKHSRNEHFYHVNSEIYLPRFEVESVWLGYDKNRDGKLVADEIYSADNKPANTTEEEHRAQNKLFFDSRDVNHDGVLDFEEVSQMMYPDPLTKAKQYFSERLLNTVDYDGDGKINKEEFLDADQILDVFDGPPQGINPPVKESDDVEGPPQEPESMLDYSKLYKAPKKEEL